MDSNKVSFTTTAEDYTAYVCAVTKGIQWGCLLLTVLSSTLSIIITYLVVALLTRFSFYADISSSLNSGIWLFCFFIFYWFIHNFLRRYASIEYVNQQSYFLRSKEMSIDHNGIREVSKSHESFMRWDGVIGIEENDQFIFMYVDQLAAYVVPKRAFKTPEDAKDFARNARNFWNAAMAHPAGVPQTDMKDEVSQTAKSPWGIPRVAINNKAEN